jgi:7-carboxy-7-deazaguanine synthase
MSVSEVIERVRQFNCALVEVTGGEPLHQPEAFELMARLCSAGHDVLLETSGAIDVSGVDPRARIIMDVKCPGSGMTDRMHWPNMAHLRAQDEVKFVLKDRADYDWAVATWHSLSCASGSDAQRGRFRLRTAAA